MTDRWAPGDVMTSWMSSGVTLYLTSVEPSEDARVSSWGVFVYSEPRPGQRDVEVSAGWDPTSVPSEEKLA